MRRGRFTEDQIIGVLRELCNGAENGIPVDSGQAVQFASKPTAARGPDWRRSGPHYISLLSRDCRWLDRSSGVPFSAPIHNRRLLHPAPHVPIPKFIDQNSQAQARRPSDMILQGCSTKCRSRAQRMCMGTLRIARLRNRGGFPLRA
jgi:hypothetical protein